MHVQGGIVNHLYSYSAKTNHSWNVAYATPSLIASPLSHTRLPAVYSPLSHSAELTRTIIIYVYVCIYIYMYLGMCRFVDGTYVNIDLHQACINDNLVAEVHTSLSHTLTHPHNTNRYIYRPFSLLNIYVQ